AVKQANESGRLAGVELVTKAYDTIGKGDAPDPARAAVAVRNMVNDGRTIAAVGPFTSLEAGATIPITNRAGLLECSPANTYTGLTKPEYGALKLRAAHPERINYVRLSPSSDASARALAVFATNDLEAESALVVIDPRWQQDAADFTKEFTALGGRV